MASNDQADECRDDMLRDDASIEILSDEGGDSHMRDSQWSIYSAGRGSIAGSDVSSMDFQKLNIHSKMATIVHHDGRQFIERRDLDDGGLPYSAEFYLGDELWKLSGEDCFLMSPRRYIAKVSVEGSVDLDGIVDFEEAVRTLLKHLKVVKVLLDEQLEECNKAKSALKIVVDKLVDGLEENIDYKRDVMLLRSLLQKHGNSSSMDYSLNMDYFQNCSRLSSEVMSTFGNFVAKALKLIQRNEILGHPNDSSLSEEFINDTIKEALNNHRVRLSSVCPSVIKDKLKEIADDHILYVALDDMNRFNDLITFDQPLFDSVLPMIFSKFLTKLREINDEQLIDLEPMSNCIYLYVCKSLQEVVGQLGSPTKIDKIIIYSEEHGWKVTTVQEQSQTPYSKCLRQQLHMLARLANHFEPGGPFRTTRFPYEFKLFQNIDAIPEPVRIWMCLLDDCMKDLVQADIDKLQMLSCFFESYVSFIACEEFHGETLECLRRITHNALRSLTEIQTLSQQVGVQATSASGLLECNEMISSCLDQQLCEHFWDDCCQIQETLRRIVSQTMNKNVASEESTEFSCVFKRLLKDMRELPMEWFVQLPPSENRNLLLRGQFVTPVDNCWKDTANECLKVVDQKGFVKMYKFLHNGEEIPKHYQLKAIQVLLDKLVAMECCNEGKIGSMINMIKSIRKSILFLDRQPEYSCFEDFLKKVDESFSYTIEESLEDKCISGQPTKDLAATDPFYDETSDPLPDLFEDSLSRERLSNSFKKYRTHFHRFVTETARLPREKRIAQIVSDTKFTVESRKDELPEILAGVSAVWSIIHSKSGSSSEQELMKPSSFQIGYILGYYIDLDRRDDDAYRLCNVSNHQGKELILGLFAALFALNGHKVLVVCYNSRLARRNSINLIELFKAFSVDHDIAFGTAEDMAREQSRKIYDKYAANIYECLGMDANYRMKRSSEKGRTVLLVEDIDLLLRSTISGQTFKRFVTPHIPGLGLLQEKALCPNEQLKDREIIHFLHKSLDPQVIKLKAFLARPQSYTVLEGRTFEEKQYTNKALFNRHLDILNRYSHISTLFNRNLRLSSDGVMTVRSLDQYDVHDIKNEINYFTLKESDFQQTVNGHKNYGYLTLGYIPFPYAHLLKSYPLVLGFVSAPLEGTEELTLNDHYGIFNKISTPNPTQSQTKFDFKDNFSCKEHSDWSLSIMVAINAAIDRNCSVLAFFKSEPEMEQFQNEFAIHLKRRSVTAIKTASNGENRSEDEIAVDEVTVLAIEAVGPYGNPPKHRPIHVIQTFWSSDSKEEALIRRQAERSHGSGSYELIVSNRDLPGIAPHSNEKYDSLYEYYAKYRTKPSFKDVKECLAKNMEDYGKIETFCEKF